MALPAMEDAPAAAIDLEVREDVDEAVDPSTADASKRTVVGASNPFLQLFWQLAEDDDAVRASAQRDLLTSLADAQAAVVSTDALAPNVRYALKRLFRGLCSSRGRARAGFSSSLSAVLALPPLPLPLSTVLPIMDAALAPPTAPSKQEQTDFKLGYACAVLALCSSGLAAALSAAEVSAMVRRLLALEYSKVLREMAWRAVEALMEAVPWTVYKSSIEADVMTALATVKTEEEDDASAEDAAVDDAKSDAARKKKKARKDTATALVELHTLTPERLSILLAILRLYGAHKQLLNPLSSFLAPSALTPLSPSTFPALVDILSTASYTLPALHSAYGAVFGALLSTASPDWVLLYTLLASTLFAERASTAKKQQGLLVLALLLRLLQLPQHAHHPLAASVAHLFHPLLLRTLLNSLSSPSTHLHQHCKAALSALVDTARARREVILAVLAGLGGTGGKGRFDAMTKTKTVATLVGLMQREDLGLYVDGLIRSFQDGAMDEKAPTAGDSDDFTEAVDAREKHCLWALEQLYSATKHAALIDSSTSADNSATERVLRFCLFYGFFDAAAPPAKAKATPAKKGRKKKAADAEVEAVEAQSSVLSAVCRPLAAPLSEKVRAVCQTRFWSLLDDLLPRPRGKLSPEQKKKRRKEEQRASKQGTTPVADASSVPRGDEKEEDADHGDSLWALKAHECWDSLEAAGHSLLSPLTKEGRAVRVSMLGIVREVEERRAQSGGTHKTAEDAVERDRLKKERALSLLMLHLGLLQLSEEVSVTSLLQELELGYQRVWKAPVAPSDSSSKKEGKAPSRKRKAADVEEEKGAGEEEPQPVFVEVLVDILLSLLVKPSALIRSLARVVFVAFAGDVNESALSDILRVVTKKSGLHLNEGAATADDDDDDEFQPFDVDDDEEEDEGPEQKAASASTSRASTGKKRKRVVEEAVEEESSDEELVDLDALDAFLITPLTPAEQSAVDSASASFDHYDHHLANIIRLRQQGRKAQQTDLVQQQIDFQLRVTDLLDVLVRVEGRSRLLLELVMGRLMDGVVATRKTEKLVGLHERLVGLVRKIAASKEHPVVRFREEEKEGQSKPKKGKRSAPAEVPKLDHAEADRYAMPAEAVQAVMAALMERAQHAVDSEVVALLSQCLLHLVRISLPPAALLLPSTHSALPASAASHLRFVHSLYHAALTSYLTQRRSRLNSRFFSDFVHSAPALAWLSAPTIASMAVAAVSAGEEKEGERAANGFLRNDCFVWLGELFGRRDMLAALPKDAAAPLVSTVAKAVESALAYTALSDAERAQLKEAQRVVEQPTSDAPATGQGQAPDTATLSKEERLRLKLREKKKRRRQRQKSALASAAPATTTTAAEAKTAINRLKTVLNTAATVTAYCRRTGLPDGVLTASVLRRLEALSKDDVRSLKGAMRNLLTLGDKVEVAVMRAVKEEDAERKKTASAEQKRHADAERKQAEEQQLQQRKEQRSLKEAASAKAQEARLKRTQHKAQHAARQQLSKAATTSEDGSEPTVSAPKTGVQPRKLPAPVTGVEQKSARSQKKAKAPTVDGDVALKAKPKSVAAIKDEDEDEDEDELATPSLHTPVAATNGRAKVGAQHAHTEGGRGVGRATVKKVLKG